MPDDDWRNTRNSAPDTFEGDPDRGHEERQTLMEELQQLARHAGHDI